MASGKCLSILLNFYKYNIIVFIHSVFNVTVTPYHPRQIGRLLSPRNAIPFQILN